MWRWLEDRPGWDDVEAGWASAADPPVPRSWLRPTAHLARTLMTPAGSAVPIIRRPNEASIAVCPDTDRCFDVRPEDEIILEFDAASMAAPLATGLGLRDPRETLHRRLWRLGDWVPVEGERFPVFFALPSTAAGFVADVGRAAAGAGRPFLFLTGTGRWLTAEARRLLDAHQADTAAAEDLFRVDAAGGIRPVEPLEERFAGFLSAHAPIAMDARIPGRFPTPAGAKWSDVHMRAMDGHVFQIDVRDVSRRMSYHDMGMQNQRTSGANRQFELLLRFAQHHGVLKRSGSTTRRQAEAKQKDRLASDLRTLFGIADSPFDHDPAVPGWRSRFRIEPAP